ncbi:MAG: flavodoxin [Clostridiales bacterium]|nr:flavodoxin [Clostridiales bacterium]
MNKIAIVYWSGTGNTEAMAKAIEEGVKEAGAEASVFTPGEFDSSKIPEFDAIAFGCPAMGAEVLEETEFDPMFTALESDLKDKKIALFGSYGWGDGQWMREWEERCNNAGAVLAAESLMVNDAPDDDGISACKALGAALVG